MYEDVMYSFEDLEIIGVMGRKIYVKTQVLSDWYFEDGDFHWAGLLFDFSSWTKLQKEWIKNKKVHCEYYNHFCGFGQVASEVKYISDVMFVIDNEEMFVPLFKPINFHVDMEHG